MSNSSHATSSLQNSASTGQVPSNKSTILHARGNQHHWTGSGPLSIKSFPAGQAFYKVDGGQFLIDESSYLLLNAGQEYTITIDAERSVESFCIFFADGLADEVYTSCTTATTILLDDPALRPTTPLHFYDRSYPHDSHLSPTLAQLRGQHHQYTNDSGWLDEALHGVMQRLLYAQQLIAREIATVPAVRAATREELYRRLHRVRDYMAASYQQPLTLAEMAQVACLSPNHLLRVFKHLFGQSPHQYLRAIRIEQAKKLLVRGDLSVTEVCYAVGFESIGSFSWRFRREVGMSPQQFRVANR